MKTAVIGASGYTGGELLRLLGAHPKLTPHLISAHSNAGERITSVHPHLTEFGSQFFSHVDLDKARECDLVFLAMPHGESAKVAAQLSPHQKIVDLGADFRLVSAQSWEKYYGGEHAGTWTYGLPELAGHRKLISQSSRVANPGCYATAISLGAFPALDVIDSGDIVVVAASGTTGAGRALKSSLLGSEVMNSLSSYKFGGVHQHTPEIEQSLSGVTKKNVGISFTPVLAPMPRGILATITARLVQDVTIEHVRKLYEDTFASDPFVSLLSVGSMPRSASVVGSNAAHIQVAIDEHSNRLVVSVAIDNLGKGAAGQAIQNANLMCGFDEEWGLSIAGLGI